MLPRGFAPVRCLSVSTEREGSGILVFFAWSLLLTIVFFVRVGFGLGGGMIVVVVGGGHRESVGTGGVSSLRYSGVGVVIRKVPVRLDSRGSLRASLTFGAYFAGVRRRSSPFQLLPTATAYDVSRLRPVEILR